MYKARKHNHALALQRHLKNTQFNMTTHGHDPKLFLAATSKILDLRFGSFQEVSSKQIGVNMLSPPFQFHNMAVMSTTLHYPKSNPMDKQLQSKFIVMHCFSLLTYFVIFIFKYYHENFVSKHL
jgi:hypothetical protein